MKRIYSILFFVMILMTSFAQKPVNNPYSRYGLGQLLYQGYGRNLAMGQTGMASFSPYYVSKLNPASYAAIPSQRVLFNFSISNKLSQLSNTDTSIYTNVSEISHISAAMPITSWSAFSFGLSPYSGVGYLFQTSDSIYNDYSGANLLTQYEGNGGLSEIFFGTAVRPVRNLSLGANVYVRWGNLQRDVITQINEPSFNTSTYFSNTTHLAGIGYDFGVIFTDTIKNKDRSKNILRYTIAGTYTPESTLKGYETFFTRKLTSYHANDFTDTLANDTLGAVYATLPSGFSVGMSLVFYDKLTLEFNYSTKYWDGVQVLDQSDYLKRSQKYAFGLEYCKDFNSTRFWRRVAWRAGAYYNDTYWNINNTPIKDYGVTFGVGLPTRSTIVNLSFDFGVLGTTSNNLVQEKYFLFNVDLNMLDIWFVTRKFL